MKRVSHDLTAVRQARLYGRAMSDERIYEYVPDVRFKRTSIISTLRLNGESVPFMFKGTLDGDLFIAFPLGIDTGMNPVSALRTLLYVHAAVMKRLRR